MTIEYQVKLGVKEEAINFQKLLRAYNCSSRLLLSEYKIVEHTFTAKIGDFEHFFNTIKEEVITEEPDNKGKIEGINHLLSSLRRRSNSIKCYFDKFDDNEEFFLQDLISDKFDLNEAIKNDGYDFQFGSIDLAENNLIADGKNGSKYIVKHIPVSECLLNLGDNEILGEFSLNELHKFNIIPIESVSFEEHYVVSMGAEILLVPIDQIIDFLEDAVGNFIADSDDIDDFIETVSLKQRVMMTICGFIKCGCSNREELRKIFKGVKLCNNNGLVNYEISLTDTYFDWFLKDLEKIGLITTKRESLHLTNKSLDILRMAMTNPSEESQE